MDYKHILDFFFQIHNPTTLNQQVMIRVLLIVRQYFSKMKQEKAVAEEMIEIVDESGRWEDRVVTTLEPFERFWPAEDYHQDYLEKHPGGYTCHAIYFDSYLN
ncbi:MAG: peptide-methionine (S)-S-oxide reductase [Candidatus Paceibacterota bacterium]